MPSITHLLLGLLAAAAIALLAHRAHALSRGGAVAATLVGTAAMAAGWRWGALLILFFALSSTLSRLGAAAKAARTSAIVAKGGRRDAVQVLANGSIFGLAAAAAAMQPGDLWVVIGAGALAAAAADTWATEVGTLVGGAPWSVRTLRRVPVGTSGGVSVAGTLAAGAGALMIGALAAVLGLTGWPMVAAVAIGGVTGALADTALGAWAQARRRCPQCATATERIVHSCGTRTVEAGGLTWMDNDVVNLLATMVGATVAGALVAWGVR